MNQYYAFFYSQHIITFEDTVSVCICTVAEQLVLQGVSQRFVQAVSTNHWRKFLLHTESVENYFMYYLNMQNWQPKCFMLGFLEVFFEMHEVLICVKLQRIASQKENV